MIWGFIFILIGAGLLLKDLGYIPQNVELFWPLILIAVGLSIIFKKRNCCDWMIWESKSSDAFGRNPDNKNCINWKHRGKKG